MNYDIELNANDNSVLETQYAFTQGDYGQIQFSIRVKADGAYVTNAQRAYIVFTLPNGYVVTGADMSKSVATYTYPFQGNELQIPGIIMADVKLVYTDGQISSNKFSFICRYDPLHDKSFEAGPYISKLEQIYAEAQAQADYIRSLIEMLQIDVGSTPVMRSDLHNTRDAVDAGLKAIDGNMAQNILLKNDITNQYENDQNKVAGAASVFTLKTSLDTTNSNLADFKMFSFWYNEGVGTIPFTPHAENTTILVVCGKSLFSIRVAINGTLMISDSTITASINQWNTGIDLSGSIEWYTKGFGIMIK